MAQQNNVSKVLELIKFLTVEEFLELQELLKKEWNISDSELVASVAAPQSAEAAVEEDEANYNLVVKEMKDPTKKIKCTIFLKNTFKLDMQKCKEVLENIASKPVVVPNVSKEDAEKFISEAKADDIQLILERVKA
jgi:ribosomal protein L7/L12